MITILNKPHKSTVLQFQLFLNHDIVSRLFKHSLLENLISEYMECKLIVKVVENLFREILVKFRNAGKLISNQ